MKTSPNLGHFYQGSQMLAWAWWRGLAGLIVLWNETFRLHCEVESHHKQKNVVAFRFLVFDNENSHSLPCCVWT